MRRLLRLPGRAVARLILWMAVAYLKRQHVYQRVWVQGETETLGRGHVVGYVVKRDYVGEPTGMVVLFEAETDPGRKLRVDLSQIKYDYDNRQWHFYRPGSPDPTPRIPRRMQ